MKERKGFYIQLDTEEVRIVCDLKKVYAVNITQLLKNALRECHKRMVKEKEL